MGLRAWLRRRRQPDPKRPWVRPEFLALFATLMVGGAGLAWWASETAHDDMPSQEPALARDYVGVTPAESLLCAPDCNPDGRLHLWTLEHPEARIESKRAVYYQGVHIGYNLEYREP